MIGIKKYLPNTLFARSILILIVPIILILAISTYVFFERHWERMAGRFATAVASEISFIAEQYQQAQTPQARKELSSQTLRHFDMSLKYSENARLKDTFETYNWRSDLIYRFLDDKLSEKINLPYDIVVDTNESWVQVHLQIQNDILSITIPERRLFSSSGYVFLIWMIVISCVLMVVAILFMRNQIRPIKRLAVAAERFGKGRDVPFFKVEGAREVRAAARSFIDMRERINKQIQQRTTMLAGVSHDLRTPLTRMKLQAEMMPEDADVESLKSDINDMQHMIDAYLQFAKGDQNEEVQRTNILSLLQKEKERYAQQGFNVSLVYKEKENFDLYVRPVALGRCFNNILTNAHKFAGMASVTLERHDEYLTLYFDDDGVGVTPNKYEDVFKPFYREDKSRNINTGGVGLGLPITQDLILSHGGSINLDKSPLGGLRVILSLPV